jgi:hypothetical protein
MHLKIEQMLRYHSLSPIIIQLQLLVLHIVIQLQVLVGWIEFNWIGLKMMMMIVVVDQFMLVQQLK